MMYAVKARLFGETMSLHGEIGSNLELDTNGMYLMST